MRVGTHRVVGSTASTRTGAALAVGVSWQALSGIKQETYFKFFLLGQINPALGIVKARREGECGLWVRG